MPYNKEVEDKIAISDLSLVTDWKIPEGPRNPTLFRSTRIIVRTVKYVPFLERYMNCVPAFFPDSIVYLARDRVLQDYERLCAFGVNKKNGAGVLAKIIYHLKRFSADLIIESYPDFGVGRYVVIIKGPPTHRPLVRAVCARTYHQLKVRNRTTPMRTIKMGKRA